MATLSLREALDLAVGHQRAGRLAEAEAVHRAILAAHPDQFDSLRLLGLILFQDGRLDQARALIGRAAALRPDHAEAHYQLGLLDLRRGRLSEAEGHLRRALALAPDDVTILHRLAACLHKSDRVEAYPEALALFERALAAGAGAPDVAYGAFRLRRWFGRDAEALPCYIQALTARLAPTGATLRPGAPPLFHLFASGGRGAPRPLAVMLHGMARCAYQFAVAAPALAPAFDLLFVDLPGHGASDEIEEPDLAGLSAPVARLLEAVAPGRPLVLIGESLGGLVALRLAETLGARVRAVVLLDTPFGSDDAGLAAAIAGALATASADTPASVARVARGVFGLDRPPPLRPRHHEPCRAVAGRTLLVAAEHGLVTAADQETLAGLGVTVVRIPGASHLVIDERPGDCAGVITGFLRDHVVVPAR